MGCHLKLEQIFEYPTVRELAQLIELSREENICENNIDEELASIEALLDSVEVVHD